VARLILVGGGCRSGKSRFALRRIDALAPDPARRVFVATGQAFDDEMRRRIDAHRAERGEAFVTIEEPVRLCEALAAIDPERTDAVLVDCLTLWLSNLLCAEWSEARIRAEIDRLVEVARASARRVHVLLVTNEVGMGLVPESKLGRAFRDLAGIAHQRLADVADEVHAALLGCVLRLHPGPVERV
jgi:adenosylcobinamide kinase/adenosylcobinamide-phosphate guanylyltransferase